MSLRALGSEHASQFSTNESIVSEFGRALRSASNETVNLQKILFKAANKVPSEKGLIGPDDSFQDQLVLFIVHMHDEFYVPNVLIVLPVHVKTNLSRVLSQTKPTL